VFYVVTVGACKASSGQKRENESLDANKLADRLWGWYNHQSLIEHLSLQRAGEFFNLLLKSYSHISLMPYFEGDDEDDVSISKEDASE
jgi:hypothetical protein